MGKGQFCDPITIAFTTAGRNPKARLGVKASSLFSIGPDALHPKDPTSKPARRLTLFFPEHASLIYTTLSLL